MSIIDLEKRITQKEFAAIIGISPTNVSSMVSRGSLKKRDSCGVWIKDYCAYMREQAAGRAGSGDLNLATERAKLAREQRLLTELKRLQVEKEVAPITLMTLGIAKVSAQIAATLEGVPGKIKRACDGIPAAALRVVELEISKARNLAADITVELDDIDDTNNNDTGNPQSDSGRSEAA